MQAKKVNDQSALINHTSTPALTLYAVDMSEQSEYKHDHPTSTAQGALVHWNRYLTTGEETYKNAFLAHAQWLVEHEIRIGEQAGGWPIQLPGTILSAERLYLSALTQGIGLSVLIRAYQLTSDRAYLEAARRVVHTFELDILDGGVSVPVGNEGVFFEEVAIYPAAHMLNGFIFALFGLYDYVALIGDVQIEKLIQRSLTTMHCLLDEFDLDFWACSDLLHRHLASPVQLALQTTLLKALARYSDCDCCLSMASRWERYHRSFISRLRYKLRHQGTFYARKVWNRVQSALFPRAQSSTPTRICVSVPAFPVMGGVLTVLEGIAQVMKDAWQVEYMTQHLGPGREQYTIHQFGTRRMTPLYFPFAWLYVIAGAHKFISLMRHHAGYHVILPQDGVFSAALAGLAGKITGVRVVCIDHGDLSLFTLRNMRLLRAERIAAVATKPWPWAVRLLAEKLLVLYWPSRYLLARIAARLVDHFLIPGVPGDSIEEGCKIIGIPASRITRYPSMIDINRHEIPDAASRAMIREQKGIAVNAIVVAIVCRLSPEKGLDIALESISRALSTLPSDLRERVRIVIAGDGQIRKQIEEDVCQRRLSQTCMFWGDLAASEVITLLGISDIFLYTSTRGACYAMALLEAMASSCAVVASTEPLSNAVLLSEGRGIAVPAGDAERTSQALVELIGNHELCRRMGQQARKYIAEYHSPTVFRRTLQRATYWAELGNLLAGIETQAGRVQGIACGQEEQAMPCTRPGGTTC